MTIDHSSVFKSHRKCTNMNPIQRKTLIKTDHIPISFTFHLYLCQVSLSLSVFFSFPLLSPLPFDGHVVYLLKILLIEMKLNNVSKWAMYICICGLFDLLSSSLLLYMRLHCHCRHTTQTRFASSDSNNLIGNCKIFSTWIWNLYFHAHLAINEANAFTRLRIYAFEHLPNEYNILLWRAWQKRWNHQKWKENKKKSANS